MRKYELDPNYEPDSQPENQPENHSQQQSEYQSEEDVLQEEGHKEPKDDMDELLGDD